MGLIGKGRIKRFCVDKNLVVEDKAFLAVIAVGIKQPYRHDVFAIAAQPVR